MLSAVKFEFLSIVGNLQNLKNAMNGKTLEDEIRKIDSLSIKIIPHKSPP